MNLERNVDLCIYAHDHTQYFFSHIKLVRSVIQKITEDEIEMMRDMLLTSLDANRDGKIEITEVRPSCRKHL